MTKLIIITSVLLSLIATPTKSEEKENALLIYAQSVMNMNDYCDMIKALEIGKKYFKTDPDIVITVIYIESHFKVKAHNKISNDYGLSQQNEKYYLDRYKYVKKILDREKIACNINNKYDIYLNVLSCFYYLDFCINQKGSVTKGIKKYNGTGARAEAYLNKFLGVYYS